MHVAVIGAGIAGLSAAYFLRAGGAQVTVFESRAGAGLETSFANGSLLHPSLVEPWNEPGVLRTLLKNLGNSESAMLLRLRAVPGLAGWGLRFIRESSPSRFRANTLANVALARHSLAQLSAMREHGVEYASYRRGSLVVQRSEEALGRALAWREWLAPHGVPFRKLSRDELIALEPALAPVAHELVGATHQVEDEGGDPKRYCDSVLARLRDMGAQVHFDSAVARLLPVEDRVGGLVLADGRSLSFNAVVLAAAAWSAGLARQMDLRIPVKPVKGYSITLPRVGVDGTDIAPRIPVIDPALHMAVVPVGDERVRVAGTAEFAGFDARVLPERVRNLRRLVARLYPRYVEALGPEAGTPWVGLRPMSPDGVALVGETRVPGLYLNTGHGHTGWTLSAGSGHLLACLVLGTPPPLDPAPYRPGRFSGA
jgi:D-amino-acid dehydrogenase